MKILTNVSKNLDKLVKLLPDIETAYVLAHHENEIPSVGGNVTIYWVPLAADNTDFNPDFIKEVELIVLEPGHKDALMLMAISGFATLIPVQFVYEKDNELYLNENTYADVLGLHTALIPYVTGCIKLAVKLFEERLLDSTLSDKLTARLYEEFDGLNKSWKQLEDNINTRGRKLVEDKLGKYF